MLKENGFKKLGGKLRQIREREEVGKREKLRERGKGRKLVKGKS